MTAEVISDLHLGTPQCNKYAIQQYINRIMLDPPDELFLAGDILDLWRRNNADVLYDNRDILNALLSVDTHITWIVGNHDYGIIDIAERTFKTGCRIDFPSDIEFCKDTRYRCLHGSQIYYITHGYDIDVQTTMEYMPVETYEAFAAAMCRAGDTVGSLASMLWEALSISSGGLGAIRKMTHQKSDTDYMKIYNVLTSGTAHLLSGAHSQDGIISGHTHWAFLHGKYANTGSWCTECGIPLHNTWITIHDDGHLTLDRL